MNDSKLQIPEADELRVFNAEETRARLGGISESYYYEIRSKGRLRYSRLQEGGMVVHTPTQLRDYIFGYLDGAGEVNVRIDGVTDEVAARRKQKSQQDRPAVDLGARAAVRRGAGRRGV